jgi:hypothetical protein
MMTSSSTSLPTDDETEANATAQRIETKAKKRVERIMKMSSPEEQKAKIDRLIKRIANWWNY